MLKTRSIDNMMLKILEGFKVGTMIQNHENHENLHDWKILEGRGGWTSASVAMRTDSSCKDSSAFNLLSKAWRSTVPCG